jgi:EpsI family protein
MSLKHTIIAALIIALTIVAGNYLSHVENIKPNKAFSTFPKNIAKWSGKENRFDEKIYEILGVDDSFLANYTYPDGRWVELYIGFYQSQRKGDLIHSPKNCVPGGGWKIIETRLEDLNAPGFENGEAKAIKLVLQKGDNKQIMLYWFHSRGRIIHSQYMQKIYLVIDSITRHRTDGSFVRLIALVTSAGEDAATAFLKEFAEKLMPILQEYIPS